MEEKTISAKLANIKRGRYFVLEYITTKNGLKKAVRGVFRFVKYENIKGVVKVGKTNPNEQWLSKDLVYNTNTKKTYLQLATTNHKNKCKYYNGETEITKAEYELVNKPRTNATKPVVIRLDIENIVRIG